MVLTHPARRNLVWAPINRPMESDLEAVKDTKVTTASQHNAAISFPSSSSSINMLAPPELITQYIQPSKHEIATCITCSKEMLSRLVNHATCHQHQGSRNSVDGVAQSRSRDLHIHATINLQGYYSAKEDVPASPAQPSTHHSLRSHHFSKSRYLTSLFNNDILMQVKILPAPSTPRSRPISYLLARIHAPPPEIRKIHNYPHPPSQPQISIPQNSQRARRSPETYR